MKVIIAPDSFKGCLNSKKVAEAISEGIKKVDRSIETVIIPIADGGEGTVDTLIEATNGEILDAIVMDPLKRNIKAKYGVLGDKRTCVIEVAIASGLALLTEEEKNPLHTTSYGTGQLIKHALDRGYRNFIIGLGGSATNDGGAGILQALGVKLLDEHGNDIPFGAKYLNLISEIDLTGFDARISESKFVIASDVENPFIGINGASKVFGPQKGATKEIVAILERNLSHFADVIERTTNVSVQNIPGSGAAGGIGGALIAFFNGQLARGIDIVIKETALEKEIKTADIVITGEGKIDFQTSFGKAPVGISMLAKKYNKPVIAIVGSVGKDIEQLRDFGIDSIVSIVNSPMDFEEACKRTDELLSFTAEQIMRIYLLNSNGSHLSK